MSYMLRLNSGLSSDFQKLKNIVRISRLHFISCSMNLRFRKNSKFLFTTTMQNENPKA